MFGFFSIWIIVSNLVSYSSFILQPQSRKLSNGCSRIGSLPIQGSFQISQVSIVNFFSFFVLLSRFCVGKEFFKNITVYIFIHIYLLICWLKSSAVPTVCLNRRHSNRWMVWGCVLKPSMELCKGWHDTVLTISKFLFFGDTWWGQCCEWCQLSASLFSSRFCQNSFVPGFFSGKIYSSAAVLLVWGLLSFLNKL